MPVLSTFGFPGCQKLNMADFNFKLRHKKAYSGIHRHIKEAQFSRRVFFTATAIGRKGKTK
jgi:hypothetical protein